MLQKEGTAPRGAPGDGEQDRFQKRVGVGQQGPAVNHHACLVSHEDSPARNPCLGSGAWRHRRGCGQKRVAGEVVSGWQGQ